MIRIAGVNLEENWKTDFALTKIQGIGWSLSKQILAVLNIDPDKKLGDLSPRERAAVTSEIEKYPTEGELGRSVRANMQRLQVIGTYRGVRHSKKLPARGQRTRSNARTKRGKRKTVGAFKKDDLTKMQTTKKEETK